MMKHDLPSDSHDLENECTFLVDELPYLEGVPSLHITQHYISPSPEPLRIRQSVMTDGTAYEITRKLRISDDDKSRKIEKNIPLDEAMYLMFTEHSLRFIVKTRHLVDIGNGLTAELDVFEGDLKGLVWVEVEFPTEEARTKFMESTKPSWFGRDITDESWSSNSKVAGKTYAEVRELIDASAS